MATKTTAHQLIEIKLGATLAPRVRKARKAGASWQKIATDLAVDTGIHVTPESIRNWMADEPGMDRATKTTASS
jgi:hypothetical protein